MIIRGVFYLRASRCLQAMKFSVLIFYVFLTFLSCGEKEQPLNRFNDPAIIAIADLQDRRSADSLLTFLNHSNPAYRQAASLAFASIQDSNYVEPLRNLLLEDDDTLVRKAAAYAIGQTYSSRSEQSLIDAAGKEKSKPVLAEIIQSYGKVARAWKLNVMENDSVIAVAMAWAYYRMAFRGVAGDDLNIRSAGLLNSSDPKIRLAAAHYFARGAKNFERYEGLLRQVVLKDEFEDVRMAAALTLGKIKSDSALYSAMSAAQNDRDDRVRTNAIRALQNFPLERTKGVLAHALADKNANVSIAASEAIKAAMKTQHYEEFLALAQTTRNWRSQANLYEAVLSVSSTESLLEEIKLLYKKSTNAYQKAALLTALQHSPTSYAFLQQQLLQSEEPVIKSSAAAALVAMNYHKDFDPTMAGSFAKFYVQAIQDGDAAVIGIISGALADSALNYRATITNFDFLKQARQKLKLPKDYESVIPLEAAIAHFERRRFSSSIANSFNHPVDWSIVRRIPSDQKAVIKTSKGNITIRLLIDEAPGSVLNFILLASKKYYDDRFIHRVVPNFVVQDGCPRGDGWGGEAYSIRSEFSPHRYSTGSVGMASAGKDTEGTQWFITHSPTPHLEGRYTLFAVVESGMDIVQSLEVGDRVNSVEIIDFTPL